MTNENPRGRVTQMKTTLSSQSGGKYLQSQKRAALPSMTFFKDGPSQSGSKKTVTLPPNIVALQPTENNGRSLNHLFTLFT